MNFITQLWKIYVYEPNMKVLIEMDQVNDFKR